MIRNNDDVIGTHLTDERRDVGARLGENDVGVGLNDRDLLHELGLDLVLDGDHVLRELALERRRERDAAQLEQLERREHGRERRRQVGDHSLGDQRARREVLERRELDARVLQRRLRNAHKLARVWQTTHRQRACR